MIARQRLYRQISMVRMNARLVIKTQVVRNPNRVDRNQWYHYARDDETNRRHGRWICCSILANKSPLPTNVAPLRHTRSEGVRNMEAQANCSVVSLQSGAFHGTFETCPPILTISASRRRPEVNADRQDGAFYQDTGNEERQALTLTQLASIWRRIDKRLAALSCYRQACTFQKFSKIDKPGRWPREIVCQFPCARRQ